MCAGGADVSLMDAHIPQLAECYLNLYEKAVEHIREFFGLRDFYRYVNVQYYITHYKYCTPGYIN